MTSPTELRVVGVSAVGLVVAGTHTVISYRPVDEASLTFEEVYVRRHRNGAWDAPSVFGPILSTQQVTYGTGRAEFSTRLRDGRIHLRRF